AAERIQEVAPASDRAQWKAVRDGLAERREVGGDAQQRLRPAEGDAEPGDHLVEDQHGALAVAPGADRFDVPRSGRDHARVAEDRLEDDRGDLPTVEARGRAQGVRVVPGEHDEVLHRGVGLAAGRKSTRLNSSHLVISYAVFCLKKKKTT